MNKGKLRSLMFHAGFCNEDGGWDDRPIHEQEHDNFQRFAELIVKECMDVASPSYMSTPEQGVYYVEQAINRIAEHFGVEDEQI